MSHKTTPIWVRVDVDKGIAHFVKLLQNIPGVRTYSSCQGTLYDKGPNPYRAYVYVTWENEKALTVLRGRFDMTYPARSKNGAYVHPTKEPRP